MSVPALLLAFAAAASAAKNARLTPNALPVLPASKAVAPLVAPRAAVLQAPAPRTFLVAAQPEHAGWLDRVVAAAQKSKTGRRVLRDAELLVGRQGRPIVVAVGEPRDWAAFDFDSQVLWMSRGALKKSARHGATTLVHEVRHAVQLGQGLPDMFELELDAYMHDFRVAHELGDKALPGTYDAAARAAFRRGPEDFIKYLRKYYKNDVARHGRAKEYAAELRASLASSLEAAERASRLLGRRLEVLDAMRKADYPAAALDAYHQESVAPVVRRMAAIERSIFWAKRDLALHEDARSRKRAAAFARRAVKRLEKLSAELDVR